MLLSWSLVYWMTVKNKLRMRSNLFFTTKNYLFLLFIRISVKTLCSLLGSSINVMWININLICRCIRICYCRKNVFFHLDFYLSVDNAYIPSIINKSWLMQVSPGLEPAWFLEIRRFDMKKINILLYDRRSNIFPNVDD